MRSHGSSSVSSFWEWEVRTLLCTRCGYRNNIQRSAGELPLPSPPQWAGSPAQVSHFWLGLALRVFTVLELLSHSLAWHFCLVWLCYRSALRQKARTFRNECKHLLLQADGIRQSPSGPKLDDCNGCWSRIIRRDQLMRHSKRGNPVVLSLSLLFALAA